MEYFSNPFNSSLLKNHILKDPIIDWFNIQENHKDNKYKKDNHSFYKTFIIKETNDYKKNIFNQFKKKLNLNTTNHNNEIDTIQKINNKEPLILDSTLIYNGMKVHCDIIIQIDYFNRIFPKIKNIPLHLINNQNYILINISYASIHFKSDLKECLNKGIIPYKKCMLYLFSQAIKEILKYSPKCFILGKEYYYKKTKLSNDEFISNIIINDQLRKKYKDSYNWIIYLRKNYKNMYIDTKPSHKELYPNMNNKDSEWENEKFKLSNRIKEITLVWNITYEERCSFIKKNIYCWDDPKLLAELKESKKKLIQERMIHMNKNNDILIYPRKNISPNLKEVLNNSNNIFFDVESFLNMDETVDPVNLSKKLNVPILAIIGLIHNEHFYDFTIQKYNLINEEKIIRLFANKLWNIYKKKGKILIFHWGHAECKYMEYIHTNYSHIHFPDYKLVDILVHFRMEPIIVQGIFQFGLKSIGKALYKNNLIQTTWDDENDNGLEAMIKFKTVCKQNKKNIPIKRYLEISKIIQYNKIDCKVLQEIFNLLKNNYNS